MPPKTRATKTKRPSTEAVASISRAAEEGRAVRQRRGPSSAAAAAPSPPAAPAASSSSSTPSASAGRPSFMRLAVVERQLIMQALDLTSLARLASTCRQLRGEALHREAGKFISKPQWPNPLHFASMIDGANTHPAQSSPLFLKHMPMQLSFVAASVALATESASLESLLDTAALVSRARTCTMGDSNMWAESQLMRLLSLPCMQHVETVIQIRSMCENPRVQTALFSLPQLNTVHMCVVPATTLLPSAVALASKLRSLRVDVQQEPAASLRSLRAMQLAPALAKLEFDFGYLVDPPVSVLSNLIRCLPPTLDDLSVRNLLIPHGLPRPLAKALFSRTPLLQWLALSGSIETILRGLLDAGLRVLPMLREVTFRVVAPADFSFHADPDPIPPLLRCFLHRFPQVSVYMELSLDDWEDPGQLSAVQVRYLLWPRVELCSAETLDRIGGPPSPHASDDEEDSDVEEWLDPLEAEAH